MFGPGGEGSGSQECAVEVLVRGGADGAGRRRGVERVLEGWPFAAGGACELRELESLKSLWAKRPVFEVSLGSILPIYIGSGSVFGAQTQGAPDPTQNLSFNLNLTPEQQRSRAQVPLPYAHEGMVQVVTWPNVADVKSSGKPVGQTHTPAAILYDPDSADDLDDDDPDEDLDI